MVKKCNRAAAIALCLAVVLPVGARGADDPDEKRKALWQELQRVLPQEYRVIDAYCEGAGKRDRFDIVGSVVIGDGRLVDLSLNLDTSPAAHGVQLKGPIKGDGSNIMK